VSGKGSRRGGLSDEDHALWGEVTKSVAPLPLRRRPLAPEVVVTSREKRPQLAPLAPRPSPPRFQPVAPQPALAVIDRRTRQRLTRGTAAVEARLDLHGMTQSAARARLESFLRAAQARGLSMVLVITGKGREGPAEPHGETRGVLRRQVPLWLALPELRAYVVGFSESGPAHGGAGALYVRIRKRKQA
jgi:DNA-nicking Smr family endonuclease